MTEVLIWIVVVMLVEVGKVLIVEYLVPWIRQRRARGEIAHCNYVHNCGLWCAQRFGHEGACVDARGHEWNA